MKNKNFSLFLFSLLIITIFFIFAFKSSKQIYQYYSLSASAPITVKDWSVEKKGKNQYLLIATFTYSYQGKEFEARASLGSSYPNPWAAAEAVKRQASKNFICWFSPKNSDHPFLIKKFPLHSLLSSIILATILLYFCGLTLYFQRGKREKK